MVWAPPLFLERALWSANFRAPLGLAGLEGVSTGEPFSIWPLSG